MHTMIEFAPIILVVLMFILQTRLFVTPQELERKHREILEGMEERYAPMFALGELKEQFSEMKNKIDKIYNHFIDNNH